MQCILTCVDEQHRYIGTVVACKFSLRLGTLQLKEDRLLHDGQW